MSECKKTIKNAARRAFRVRERLKNSKDSDRLRVSVFRSAKQIYAQLIDDRRGVTLASSSSLLCKDVKGDKKTLARVVGRHLAEQAKNIVTKVVFDRGCYKYHGRVRELAEGLREGGLII